jgi:hypothetical protein
VSSDAIYPVTFEYSGNRDAPLAIATVLHRPDGIFLSGGFREERADMLAGLITGAFIFGGSVKVGRGPAKLIEISVTRSEK